MRQQPLQSEARTDAQFSRSMNGYLALEKAVPRGQADRVAYFMGVSPDLVRRWLREPEYEEGTATGRRSPLDRLCDLITAVFIVNPDGADLVVEHVRTHLEMLKSDDQPSVDMSEVKDELQQLHLLLTRLSDKVRAAEANKLSVVK
jgi:hypothetical protein